jgi:alcohol oxidase
MAEDEVNIASQFLAVAAEYDKERGFTSDANDFLTSNAYAASSYYFSSDLPSDILLQRWPRLDLSPLQGFILTDMYTLRYIDLESGRRSDAPHHYIYNQSHNNNLKILERSRVIRVIFECVATSSILQ